MSNDYGHALDWMRRNVGPGRLPVGVFGAATSDGPQRIAAFGENRGRTAREDDHFALFSVTKPIVGLAALRLVERGLLSLRTPLREALPGIGTADVELQHLLSHTSGMVDPFLVPPSGVTLRELLLTVPQEFAPGTMTRYNNLAFEGIAALVEHASGRSLAENVDELVRSVGAEGITFDDDRNAREVEGFDGLPLSFADFAALRHPAGGLYARAQDLLQLGAALLRADSRGSAEIVHPSTLAASRVRRTVGLPQLLPDPVNAGQAWGLPWNLRYAAPGLLERRLYGHGGWSGCQLFLYPDYDACFVLMTNLLDPAQYGVDIDGLHNSFTTGLGVHA